MLSQKALQVKPLHYDLYGISVIVVRWHDAGSGARGSSDPQIQPKALVSALMILAMPFTRVTVNSRSCEYVGI